MNRSAQIATSITAFDLLKFSSETAHAWPLLAEFALVEP